MPVTLGSTTVGVTTSNTSSLSFSFVSDGSPIIVRVNLRGQTANPTSVAVTYNSVSVPLITGATAFNATSRTYAGIFYLANPAVGSNTLAISWVNLCAGVAGISHVYGGGIPQNGNGATGTDGTLGVTISSTNGNLVLDTTNVSTARTLTSDTTLDFSGTSTGATTNINAYGSSSAGATSVNMTYTPSGIGINWAIAGCDIPSLQSGFFLFF